MTQNMLHDATKRFELTLLSSLGLIDLLFALLAGIFLINSYAYQQEILQVTGNNLVKLLERSIADKARLVDDAVTRVERALERQLRAGGIDKNRLEQVLDLEQEQLPEIEAIRITNTVGDVLWGRGVTEETKASYADRDFFHQLRDQIQDILVVTEPMLGRVSGRWIIAFTRAYHNIDGSFAGVVSAAVPVETFEKLMRLVNLRQTDTVVLRYTDMGLIARVPTLEGEAGQPGHKKVSREFTEVMQSGVSEATFHTARTPDTIERTYFFRRLTQWPFTLAVGLVDKEYLEHWKNLAIWVSVLLGIFYLGTTASVLLIIRYLRERALAESIIRDNEEKYRVLFNNEIYAICIFDLETYRILDVNSAYTRLYGYSRAELLSGMTINDITAEQEISVTATRQAISEGTIFIPLRYHRRRDGSVFPVEIVGGPYTWQGRRVMFGLAHDISSREQTKDALIASEERFRKLFEGNAAMMLIIDPEKGSIVEANQAAADFYGWSIEELKRMRIQEINTLPPAAVKNEMENTKGSGALRLEFQHRKADGSIRDVEVFSSKVDLAGKPLLYSIIHDISERKQAEAQKIKLESLNRQLEKSNSLMRMAGAVAHHFNNQLGVVMGNLEMAINDLAAGQQPGQSLYWAMLGARKASEVSSQMLTYLGQTAGIYIPLDLSETCRRFLPFLRAVIPAGVNLKTSLPEPGPTITADAKQLQLVLTNLITNAWESAEGEQQVILLTVGTISPTDIPEISRWPVEWRPEDKNYAYLEVRDIGCGIAVEDIDKIFDPFFSRKFPGRGLGLANVLGIVKAHGGVIAVESEQSHGSIFRVFFPLSMDTPAQ
jgi:PAS domain S-box-containing protein